MSLPPHAYTVAGLAERWGTSDTFVYDQIKAGKLRAFKLGNKLIRIRPEAVEEYEAAGAIDTRAPALSQGETDARHAATGRLIRAHAARMP